MGPGLLLLLGLGLGMTSGQVDRFERSAARDIAAKLEGPRKQIEVEIQPSAQWGRVQSATISARDFSLDGLPLFTEPDLPQSGRLDLLRLRLENARLRGLRIKELSADIRDSRFDLNRALRQDGLRLSRSGVGYGRVVIAEDDLADFIVAKFAEVKRATVKVYNDVVWVEGFGEFLIIKTEFAVIAKIESPDGYRLNLADAKIYFDWNRASPAAAQALLQTLNPVVDLKEDLGLYDAIKVDEVRLRGGVLVAEGQTRIPVRPGQ